MGWYSEKEMTDQYAEEKRWVFSFDLKEESEESREVSNSERYGGAVPETVWKQMRVVLY